MRTDHVVLMAGVGGTNDDGVARPTVSVVLPARNEAMTLARMLDEIRRHGPRWEIVVVSDGSTDNTSEICSQHGVKCVAHPYPKGNGAAVKSGARAARGDVFVFMDADGQHNPADIPFLLSKLDDGYDMAVGARGRSSQAGAHRAFANSFYNRFATWMVNHKVADLTSGFRAVRADKFRKFLYLLPNGFSYPTTITMGFFRAGYSVAYIPIQAARRVGKSHIRLGRDGLRFLLIIFKVGTLYSPLKLFVPISLSFFLTALGYYLHTYITIGRFTNMSALLFTTSVLIFLIGLISEQITTLIYRETDWEKRS